jgi:hypothetical protein
MSEKVVRGRTEMKRENHGWKSMTREDMVVTTCLGL